MKLEVNRRSLSVIPETPQDEAYLEEVLGLNSDGDFVPLVRRNAMGLSCWGSAEAKHVEPCGQCGFPMYQHSRALSEYGRGMIDICPVQKQTALEQHKQ